jgi:hypothetical protein
VDAHNGYVEGQNGGSTDSHHRDRSRVRIRVCFKEESRSWSTLKRKESKNGSGKKRCVSATLLFRYLLKNLHDLQQKICFVSDQSFPNVGVLKFYKITHGHYLHGVDHV